MRRMLCSSWIAAALIAVGSTASAGANAVTDENALPGTSSFTFPPASRAIEGYADRVSAVPGEAVNLRVSAGGVRYRVEVFRLGWYGGAGARRMLCLPSCSTDRAGVAQRVPPAPHPTTGIVDAGWSTTDGFTVGSNWTSGYYVAQLRITSGPETGRSRFIPLIVREGGGRRAPIVVMAPVNTWQAYNGWGGKSLYDNKSVGGRASHVSFNRPYKENEYTLFEWDYHLIRYLEREGWDVSYLADVDLHRSPGLLTGRAVAVTAGHGEYWSKSQRDAFEQARNGGVDLVVAGANTGYWQVRYENAERTLVGYKSFADPIADPALETVQFRQLQPARPECSLLGVQWNLGASAIPSTRGYTVTGAAASDPWFAGTGFAVGDVVGGIVGYEWDAITSGCASPTALFHWEGSTTGLPDADAVRLRAGSGAQVFSTGSMQFAWALDGWQRRSPEAGDPRVQRFMRNVLSDMTGQSTTLARDAFGRTATAGWGTADVGGAWTRLAGSSGAFSVSGGAGRIAAPGDGAQQLVHLASVARRDVDARLRVAFGGPAVGGTSTFVYVVLRRQADGSHLRLGVYRDGAGRIVLKGTTSTGTAVFADTPTSVGVNRPFMVRVQATGAFPTTLRVKAWDATQAEPAGWHVTGSNGTAVPQAAGTVGIRAVTSAPAGTTLLIDDLAVDRAGTA